MDFKIPSRSSARTFYLRMLAINGLLEPIVSEMQSTTTMDRTICFLFPKVETKYSQHFHKLQSSKNVQSGKSSSNDSNCILFGLVGFVTIAQSCSAPKCFEKPTKIPWKPAVGSGVICQTTLHRVNSDECRASSTLDSMPNFPSFTTDR